MSKGQPYYFIQYENTSVAGGDTLTKAVVAPGTSVTKTVKKEKTAHQKDTLQRSVTTKEATTGMSAARDSGIFVHETVSLPKPVPRKKASPLSAYNEWLAVLLIFSVVIIGFLRLTSMKYLSELFRAAFNMQSANKMFTSVNIRNSKPSFLLSALFIFNTGIFIFEALAFYGHMIFDQTGFPLLMSIWGLLLAFGFIKLFLYRSTGYVFDNNTPTMEYLFNSSLLNKIYAIALIPLISVIPFINVWMVPNLIKLGVGIFISLYILQLIRGAAIFLQNSFSLFYLFLYFCALEILPLVIFYKILFG